MLVFNVQTYTDPLQKSRLSQERAKQAARIGKNF